MVLMPRHVQRPCHGTTCTHVSSWSVDTSPRETSLLLEGSAARDILLEISTQLAEQPAHTEQPAPLPHPKKTAAKPSRSAIDESNLARMQQTRPPVEPLPTTAFTMSHPQDEAGCRDLASSAPARLWRPMSSAGDGNTLLLGRGYPSSPRSSSAQACRDTRPMTVGDGKLSSPEPGNGVYRV